MALPLPPEFSGAPVKDSNEGSRRAQITINLKFHGIRGNKNIQQSLKFSPWCLAEEAVEQIVPFFLKQDIIESAPTEVETNFMSYSLFLGDKYLHKDKSLVELQLQDGADVTLKYEGQTFTLVKVQLPPNLATPTQHFATFKVTRRTPVRSALKRLYLRFCEAHDVLAYGIAPIETSQQGAILDIDSFLVEGATPPRLVYRASIPADPSTAHRTLNLTVLVRAPTQGTDDAARAMWRSVHMKFSPQDLVAKAIRQLDVVAGALDNFGHCGFFVTPPPDEDGEERGFWLMEDKALEFYTLTEEDMIEYRPHFRSYKVHLSDNTFVFHKFDQDATVKTLLDILINNQNISPKAAKNFGLYFMPVHGGMNFEAPDAALDPARTLWSYDTTVELRFREHLHPITVFFFERTQDTFHIDFSIPVEKILPTILSRFRIVIPAGIPFEPSPISLRKLGGHELDRSRTLRQLNINPGDGLLMKVAVGFEAVLGLEPTYEMPIYRRPPPPLTKSSSQKGANAANKGGPSPRTGHAKALPPVPGEEINIWEEPPSADHVVFDSENKLQAGTLNKLVERLTSETAPDLEFMKAFLMTHPKSRKYQSFTTARRLLSKIFERFRVPTHIESTQKLSIQLRVCNVIKYWVEHHYVDFNHNMTQEIVAFVDLEIAELLPGAARNLRNAVLKRTCDIKTDAIKKATSDDDPLAATNPPAPPRNNNNPASSTNNNLGKTASLPNLPSSLRSSPVPHAHNNESPPYSPTFTPSPPSSPSPIRKGSTAVSSKAQRTLGVSKDKVTSPNVLTTSSSFDKWRAKKKRGSLNLSKERSSPTPTSVSPLTTNDFLDKTIYKWMRPY